MQLRRLLQETIDVDPELLGRFANYLSTPDEETAAMTWPPCTPAPGPRSTT